MTFTTGFPLVVKLGTHHAGKVAGLFPVLKAFLGFGKMRIQDQSDFEDFRSVVALQGEYVTAEVCILLQEY